MFSALGFYDNKVWNCIKKTMMDSLKQQKTLLNPYAVPTIISTIAFCDYNKKYKARNIQDHSLMSQFLVRRPLRYNSVLFQSYHEIAKYLSDEETSTSLKGKMMIIKSLAFAGYNNDAFFDTFIQNVVKSVIHTPNNAGTLVELVHCFSLLKRVNPMTEYIVKKVH